MGGWSFTFDISLDNKAAITADVAKDLLKKLGNAFKSENPDILTTEFVKTFNKKLLPWKLTWRSLLVQLRRFRLPRKPFLNLTVFCGIWRKASDN